MLTSAVVGVLAAFSVLVAAYLAGWGLLQLLAGTVSGKFIWRYRKLRTRRDRALARNLDRLPFVSVIVPAYNEAFTIVDSVRSFLALDYTPREVVVVNDGSSDDSLRRLTQAFQLLPVPMAFHPLLHTEPVRGMFRSIREPGLVVIDKQNGGSKADALNAGINAASGELVLTIDADTVIEADALNRAVLPFLEDAETVAVGGNVGVLNGCRLEKGRVADVRLPDSWLARFQVVEYMRSFLLHRAARGSLNALSLIAGAFGLFRRDAVIAVGGFDRTAIGEDMDLTIRLQRHYRGRQPFKIAFDPFPLCSTQVPEDRASLRAQRCRWRRGLLQVLWRHRVMIANPRFGLLGAGVLPYIVIFDGLGPLLEITGLLILTVAAVLGLVYWQHYFLLIGISLLFGVAVTLFAVLLSDMATGRYLTGRDLRLLVAAALLENLGYRQLNSWWGCVATAQFVRGQHGWGVIKRQVFEGEETTV